MPDVQLFINGEIFSGWTSVIIKKSLEQIAGSFELGFTEKFPGQTAAWKIRLGDSCTVSLEGILVITGFVDDINIAYTDTSHTLLVRGRDITGDLVDCSHIGDVTEWKEQELSKIVNTMCSPFDIPVVKSVDTGKNIDHRINEGDTIFESISKLCKQRSILPVNFGDGKLTLTRVENTELSQVPLVLGENILSGNFVQSNRDRHSKYIIKSQGTGFDEKLLTDFTEPLGESLDANITRYRPLVIISETQGDNASLQERARWESTTRAGRSRKFVCKVQGWKQFPFADLWEINKLVKIKDNESGINDTWLISGLNFSLTETGGTITEITTMPPVAFQQISSDTETSTAASKWESLLND